MMQAGHVTCMAPTGWSLILPISLPGFVAVPSAERQHNPQHLTGEVGLSCGQNNGEHRGSPRGSAPRHGTDGAGVQEQEQCEFGTHLLGALGGNASQSMQ